VRKGYSADQEVTVATGKGFRIPGGGNVVEFPDLAPPGSSRLSGGSRGLMSPEIGTQFDWGQRLFAYYGEGDVFDYGEWNSRDMKTMFSRDGVSAALAAALTLPIRGAPVKIDPAKGDKGEAEFITSVLMTPDTEGGMKTPVKELIGQVTSAQLYRRAFFEKTFKVRESDEKVIYDKIAYRPPATCQARFNDRSGENNGFRQQVWLFGGNLMLDRKQKVPGYVDIPRVRSFIYTHGKYREPMTGVSEMDIAYWCYQTKMKLLYLWYHFLENQALPRTVVYGNDQPEANTRADNIAALKSSGVVGMERPPEGGKAFDILEPSGDGGSFFSAALTFLEEWQVMSVLAGFLNLVSSGSRSSSGGASGSSKGGSYAMSADQSSYFMASRSTIADEIAEAMSYDVIRPMIIMNFGSGAAFPQWKFGPMDDSDSQQLLTLFGQLAAAPTMNIPIPVFDLICERMANILNLNEDQVAQALASTASQRAEQLAGQAPPGMPPEAAAAIGGLNGMASAAMGIAQQAGATNNGSSNSGLRPPPAPGARAPGVPQRPAAPPAPPAQGPPTPPNTPPMSPVPGKLTR
jgi:hypothetical protein